MSGLVAPRDREGLRNWYRRAMLGRLQQLRLLRDPIRAGDPDARAEARSVGQALRGSGGTFGFPELSAMAALLETSSDEHTLRRVEGLIAELLAMTGGEARGAAVHAEWLQLAAGVRVGSGLLGEASGMTQGWAVVRAESGMDGRRLAAAVAEYLGLEVGDPGRPGRSALRLVPEALLTSAGIVPLREDAATIEVATAEPTSLALELELRRLTGREPVFRVAPPEDIAASLALLTGVEPREPEPVVPELDDSGVAEAGVLVVDDDATCRTLMRGMLERRGVVVFEAGDGLEALERLRAEPSIDLVVADLNMPRLDGLELIWAVRGAEAWADLPLIVVTAHDDEVLEAQLLEEGADDYIRKPVDPRLFVARVEATMRRRES